MVKRACLRNAGRLFLFAGLAWAEKVPFVGCPTDGQAGWVAAPARDPVEVAIGPRAAGALAYYGSAGVGLLAPRGWHCLEVYGSSGGSLMVRPALIDGIKGFDVEGSAVISSYAGGEGSGRYEVAQMLARVFPAFRFYVERVREMFDYPENQFPAGPFAADSVRYLSRRALRYRTPGGKEGLGTLGGLRTDNQPVEGLVVLQGEHPDLVHVVVRLPEGLRWLAPVILGEAEKKELRTAR